LDSLETKNFLTVPLSDKNLKSGHKAYYGKTKKQDEAKECKFERKSPSVVVSH
jgi:hypothetical protein